MKVEGPDECIYTDASTSDATEFAIQYGAFREVFNEIVAPPGRRPPPSKIVLFRKVETLRNYVASPSTPKLVAYTAQVDGTGILALSVADDRDGTIAQAIEFDTIWLLPRTGYRLPLWMGQGAGEVFESMKVKKSVCVLGPESRGIAHIWYSNSEIDWDRFFEINTGSPEYNGIRSTGMYHAQAWALMHLVLLGGDSPRERFQALAANLQQGRSPRASLEAVLGVPQKDFYRRMSGNLDETVKVPFDSAKLRAGLKISPASDAEVRVQLADLLVSAGKLDDADVQLDAARDEDKNSACVLEALARREYRRGNRSDAADYYERAIDAGSTDERAYLVSAKATVDSFQMGRRDHEGGGGEPVYGAIKQIRRALELAPADAEAYSLLARALYIAPEISADDVKALAAGMSDDAQGMALRYYHGLLCLRLKDVDGFRQDMQQMADSPHTPAQLRAAAQRVLARLESHPSR